MIKLGHYKIKGNNKCQKNWMIYGDVNKGKDIILLIEQYKGREDLIMAFDMPYIMFSEDSFMKVECKDRKEVEERLDLIKKFLKEKYKSLRWFINKDGLVKLFIVHRLINS